MPAIRAAAADVPDVEVVGDPDARLPHVVTFSCLYVDGEAIVGELDRRGFSGPVCLQLWCVGGLKQDNLRNSIAAWRAAFP